MRQGVDFYISANFIYRFKTCQCVCTVNVHRTRTAYTFPARPTEGQRGIRLIFNFDKGIEHHWSTIVQVNLVGVNSRVFFRIRVIPVYLERTGAPRIFWCTISNTRLNSRICWKRKFSHWFWSFLYSLFKNVKC